MTIIILVATLQLPTALLAASNTEETQPADDMEEVVVTGKLPPGSVIGDIPPENQLNRTDIASYGVSTISDLLNEIADLTQSDQGRDSGSAPIILVNGKRVSGINEVGDLPTESILRLDILPEEVALKYGYGAQQKVVNIILRRFFKAKVADLAGGRTTEGAGGSGTGDLSYSRIRNNDRMNVVARVKSQGSVLESERGVSSTAGTVGDPDGSIGSDSREQTLRPATHAYTVNGVVAHPFSDTIAASFNAQAAYQTSRALNGYPSADLKVPATSPFALSNEDATVDRFLSDETLHQDVDTATAHAGATLNADLPKMWRLSMIGNYDHADVHTEADRGYDSTGLQTAIEDGEIDPYGSLSPSTLGPLRREDVRAITDTGSASVLANGKLFALPAGDITTSVKLGGDFSRLDSSNRGADGRNSSRSTATGQVSVAVPLTSRANNVLGAIGNLSANVTGAVTEISSFGSLDTFGYGLYWTPHKGVSFIASINEDRQAPTLSQLDDPLLRTANLSVYDNVLGQIVSVSRISGGNPDLKADDRRVVKFGATLAPVSTAKLKLNITANYIHSATRNAVGSLRSATTETEQAFPDRFERDADGTLISVDSRPVNFDREERESIRWGFNLTRVIRAPTRPTRPPGARPQGARGFRPGAAGQQSATQNAPQAGGASAGNAARSPANSSNNAPDEVAAAGRPEGGDDSSRPSPPADGASPFDAPQADAPTPESNPADGARRAGGGGGGFRGGRGFAAAGTGGGNGAQFQLSVYDSWYFRDEVRLSAQGTTIDLLNGGTIGSGGQARHKIQLNAGLLDNGIAVRVSGSWASATRINDNGNGSGPLFYSSLAMLDLRLIANLQQRVPGKAWARGTRLTLALNNLLDARQDIHDASGATPQIYQSAFLDPYGRTVSISFRRLF